jgi:hypothetical protein
VEAGAPYDSGVTDHDLDVLDVDARGVEHTERGVGASSALIVAVCVGMAIVLAAVFAIWFTVGTAWFGVVFERLAAFAATWSLFNL